MEYRPKPIDTEQVKLSEDMIELTEYLAENTHEIWSSQRMSEGWTFGKERDDKKKQHPCLVPYDQLPEIEKDYDRNTAIGAIKLILSLGYNIELPVHKISNREKKMHKNLLSFLKSGEADLEQLLHIWHQHDPESWRCNEELYITLAERILKFAEPLQAFDIIQEGSEAFPNNVRLCELKGTTFARLGSYEKANNVLYELYQSKAKDRIETLGMLGRTHKDLWLSSKSEKDKKYHISRSRDYYLQAYKLEPSVWTGINVAATYAFEGNLAQARRKQQRSKTSVK